MSSLLTNPAIQSISTNTSLVNGNLDTGGLGQMLPQNIEHRPHSWRQSHSYLPVCLYTSCILDPAASRTAFIFTITCSVCFATSFSHNFTGARIEGNLTGNENHLTTSCDRLVIRSHWCRCEIRANNLSIHRQF